MIRPSDPSPELHTKNLLYFQVRYALSCLSYTSPSQYIQYKNRLSIVDLLVEQYSIEISLYYGIIGNNIEQIHIFPLFDFIFYSLIKQRNDFEIFAWNIFLNINFTKDIKNNLQLIIQNTFVYNHYFSHVIYLCQRLKILNSLALLIYYIERVTFDAKPNRFNLLLYLIYVDQGLTYLQTINNCFYMSLSSSRQYFLENFINKYRKKIEKLKFYCRRYIRNELSIGIHCKLDQLNLNNHLKSYILITEINFIS